MSDTAPQVALFRDGPNCPWHGPVTGEVLLRVQAMGFEVRLISESHAIEIARAEFRKQHCHLWALLYEAEEELVRLTRGRKSERERVSRLILAIREALEDT